MRQPVALQSEWAVCVWIPWFALRCEEARRPELVSQPTALLSPEDTRRVWMVSAMARRMGVKAGITVSQAIGLCPPLVLVQPDPVWYDEQFARLLLALSQVSPVIEPAALGLAYVGVDGLGALYGSPERILAQIVRALEQARLQAGERVIGGPRDPAAGAGVRPEYRLGWGRGKFAAWVAATRARPGEFVIVADHLRREFLASQPLTVLSLDADIHRKLQQLGLKTLGDLAALPEPAVTSQFGRLGQLAWRLAAGVLAEPVLGRQRPEPIVAALDFPTPLADRVMLAQAIEKLVERALRSPRRVGWRVYALRARARLEQGASWLCEITLKDPSADAHRLAAPLKTRLEQAPPAGAVEHLAVELTAFAPGTVELQLFARDAASAARAGRRQALRAAVREIQTRFHRSSLYRVIEVHPWSRLPERRYALIAYEP
jgi:nucleotidyltransferase/DNA polymerase involved in DNA repair